MIFVNRDAELSFLRRAWQEDKSQLVVIYGKRRVGKTALVKEFSNNQPHIYFLADKAPDRDQLRQLSEKVGLYFQDDFLLSRGFGAWYDFFNYIKSKGKFVMIFDEFPYLIESNPAIPSLFQKGWDEDLSQSGVFLILLGSSMGMMETEVLGHKSPLFGRRTGQILVETLPFNSAKEFFPAMSDDAFMYFYGALGGTPAYLLQFDPAVDFVENVRRRILAPEAYLYREPDFILREELREPRNYFSILRAISMGKTRPAEIINETGFDKNMVGKYLSVLTDLKIIRREVPVTEWGFEKSKKGIYLLEEHFFRFWFNYVYPNRSFIEEGQIDYVLDRKIMPSIDRFIAWSFEEVCRSRVRKGLPQGIQCNRVGRWWSKEGEIDIVGLAEDENTVVFGEAKWSVNPVGTDILNDLEKKAKLVDWPKGERKEYFVLFSRSGFTANLEKLAGERGDLLLWK